MAPATLSCYLDLNQFVAPADSTGMSTCGYGIGGRFGVGALLVDAPLWGRRTSFVMQQLVRTAEITSQSVFANGATLHSRMKAYASENLAVVELWFNSMSHETLDLNVTTMVHYADGPEKSPGVIMLRNAAPTTLDSVALPATARSGLRAGWAAPIKTRARLPVCLRPSWRSGRRATTYCITVRDASRTWRSAPVSLAKAWQHAVLLAAVPTRCLGAAPVQQ